VLLRIRRILLTAALAAVLAPVFASPAHANVGPGQPSSAGTVTLYRINPLIGSNDFRCTVPPGYKCVRRPDGPGQTGNVTVPVFEIDFDF
jgi:hypothetical protein